MKRQNIAVFVLVILGILVLALLLRHVEAPPDCISDPQKPACQNQLIAPWSVNFRTIRLKPCLWYVPSERSLHQEKGWRKPSPPTDDIASVRYARWFQDAPVKSGNLPCSKSYMENQNGTPVRQVDFTIENHSSLFLFHMNSPAARAWVSENVQDDAQFFGDALVVEWRYAQDLAAAIVRSGLVVR